MADCVEERLRNLYPDLEDMTVTDKNLLKLTSDYPYKRAFRH